MKLLINFFFFFTKNLYKFKKDHPQLNCKELFSTLDHQSLFYLGLYLGHLETAETVNSSL